MSATKNVPEQMDSVKNKTIVTIKTSDPGINITTDSKIISDPDKKNISDPGNNNNKIVKSKKMKTETKSALFMGFGAFAVLLGAISVVFWPSLFMAQLRRMMVLTKDSMSFSIWREIPIPMYIEMYMFNITNVDDILAKKNVSIQVHQMGPYVFRETHSKVNITWNDNSTVTFFNQRYWHFVPEKSNGSLSDNVTSVNPIIATVAYTMRYQRTVIKVPVDVFLRMFHDDIFLTANVTSWLFDGIDDPVLTIASHFPDLPINIPYDKFGWFYERNGSATYDGIFVMNTGAEEFTSLGNVEMWQHSNRTSYRDECGKVQGSTGELWAPELGQPEVMVFAPDVCTYMILSENGSVTVENIDGVQYAANDSVFDNGYRYPHMACYCDEIRDENCLPPGALNVSECRFGAPAFVSLPHFYNTDPYYPSKIDGLDPTEEHTFRLSLEMFTGMPLNVRAQLQINILVRHIHGITINNQLPDPDTLVPMFWFRQELEITPDYARMARFALTVRSAVPYVMYSITAVGLALLLTGIVILVRKLLKSPETVPILQEAEESQ